MAPKDVEVILMRQLASYLATPIFLVDPTGTLLFYNEPAEPPSWVVGTTRRARCRSRSGPRCSRRWPRMARRSRPTPFRWSSPLKRHRAAHRTMWIRGLDGIRRKIGATAFPLEGQGGRHLGAVAIFWEDAEL